MFRVPEIIHGKAKPWNELSFIAKSKKAIHEIIMDSNMHVIVLIKAPFDDHLSPTNHDNKAPNRGKKTIKLYILTLEQINFFNVNCSFISKINNQNS